MHVLVLGSSKGIGLEFCKQLKAKGYTITATCRSPSAELTQFADKVIEGIDLTMPNVIEKLTANLERQKFDLVIHNAGILENSATVDIKELEIQFKVNAALPILIAQHIHTHFQSECKIIFITSRMGSIADNSSGGYYGYRMSKTALNMGVKCLSIDFEHHDQWTFLALHPGYVKTDMTGHQGTSSPEKSVKHMLQVIDRVTPENSGNFIHAEGQDLPW